MDTERVARGSRIGEGGKCIHCRGAKHVLDTVETTLGELEDVSYLCPACCGTGREMTKTERIAFRLGRS